MKKKRLLPFNVLPASWGLHGEAYEIAAANYNLEGEELDKTLVEIRYRNDPKGKAKALLELQRRYNQIDMYDYDTRFAELDSSGDETALAIRKLEIDLAYQKITPYEAARRRVILQSKSDTERDLALLEIDYKFQKVAKPLYEKQYATLRKEPWVAIINSGFNPEKGIDGVFFEFDWNSHWIEFLRKNGYSGHTDDQIIEEWFSDVCRSHTALDFAGAIPGSFT